VNTATNLINKQATVKTDKTNERTKYWNVNHKPTTITTTTCQRGTSVTPELHGKQ